jgi:hypothetical protein
MNPLTRTASALFTTTIALVGCGGTNSPAEPPIDTDYSNIEVAETREGGLVPVQNSNALLNPLRNGIRLSLNAQPSPALIWLTVPNTAVQTPYSKSTQQVAGVDEPDLVIYDGRYIYTMRPEAVPTKPGFTRNVLKIAKTNPADATLEVTAEFLLQGEQTTLPVIFQTQGDDGATQFIAAVSQDFGGWLSAQPQATSLVLMPDRTKVQLLDVRDPYNVSQAWEIELDGWLRGTRKIDDTLYLVTSYRPRLSGIELPADTPRKREANERRIRNADAGDLLPTMRINGGNAQPLARPSDCVIAADLKSNEAYTDLLVITSLDLASRAVRDVQCVSTNMNGLYVARDTLYVGGEGGQGTQGSAFTVLHKFALDDGEIEYRASGAVGGLLPWANAAYFMDEYEDRLRIVTSQAAANGHLIHRLSVLEETPDRDLNLVSILPSPEHPEPIGKPGDTVHAVRFVGERAYIATARATDPLYAIDLSDPVEPFIAGEIEVPGFATHLEPLETGGLQLLLSVGREGNAGVKLELFDVSEISRLRSLGAQVFGSGGSGSEAIVDPHALTIMPAPGDAGRVRIGLPIDVFSYANGNYVWHYSGFHLLEIAKAEGEPRLKFHGVLKTEESSDPAEHAPYVMPRRVIMHGNTVYGVNGELYTSQFWNAIPPN